MKKLLLGLLIGAAALAALPSSVSAQCIAVGGVNNVPQPGIVCLSEPIADTFGATGIGIVPAASATDIACITGSATKIVRVQAIRVSGTAGTLVNVPVIIMKRASANTGGTPAVTTALPVPYALDSSDAAATATTTAWTANPTIVDSTPGVLDAANLSLTATGTVAATVGTLFDWSQRNYSEAPTLRGVAQQICVNLNATSPSSGLVNVSFRWTELAQ